MRGKAESGKQKAETSSLAVAPIKHSEALDYEIVKSSRPDCPFDVWTPDRSGGILGSGRNPQEAVKDAVRNLRQTIAALKDNFDLA